MRRKLKEISERVYKKDEKHDYFVRYDFLVKLEDAGYIDQAALMRVSLLGSRIWLYSHIFTFIYAVAVV